MTCDILFTAARAARAVEGQRSPTGSSIGPGGRRFAAPEVRNASRSPRPLGPGPVMWNL